MTYSDGKRTEARLKDFGNSEVKENIENWLQQETGKDDFVMTDCKIIKSMRGCNRQEMHSDFDIEENEDLNFIFGILPLSKPINIWVQPRNLDGEEKEERLQPGQIFLGRGSLVHGGGTMAGSRLHFMYVEKRNKEKFTDYNKTTFFNDE